MKPWSLSWEEENLKLASGWSNPESRGESSGPRLLPSSNSPSGKMVGDFLTLCNKTSSSSPLDSAKALAASKSHSEAERRRRERINKHLSTLRTLLPNTAKTDKASLLAEVIDRIKELKQQVAEISELGPVPSDADELKIDVMDASPSSPSSSCDKGKVLIKASICCADRPSLFTDLVRTLKSLHLKTVKAEMATMEGRTKNVFVMTINEDKELLEPTLTCVQEALMSVMQEPAADETSQDRTALKRAGC